MSPGGRSKIRKIQQKGERCLSACPYFGGSGKIERLFLMAVRRNVYIYQWLDLTDRPVGTCQEKRSCDIFDGWPGFVTKIIPDFDQIYG